MLASILNFCAHLQKPIFLKKNAQKLLGFLLKIGGKAHQEKPQQNLLDI